MAKKELREKDRIILESLLEDVLMWHSQEHLTAYTNQVDKLDKRGYNVLEYLHSREPLSYMVRENGNT